jgi:hypothetical protein
MSSGLLRNPRESVCLTREPERLGLVAAPTGARQATTNRLIGLNSPAYCAIWPSTVSSVRPTTRRCQDRHHGPIDAADPTKARPGTLGSARLMVIGEP